MKVAFLCSGCTETIPSPDELCEIPWWHPVGGFFMAHRCRGCFGHSLQETMDRIGNWDDEAEEQFAAFLATWKIAARFPDAQKPPVRAAAEAVMKLVADSQGRAFVPLILENLEHEEGLSDDGTTRVVADAVALLHASMADDEDDSSDETFAADRGESVSLKDTSEQFKAALVQAMNESGSDEADPQVLVYEAVARVLRRIDAGEEGLWDPANPADQAILRARA